ncbi:MAG: hypothetical protein IKK21_09285 [Clostridia bacterium]|nr:hypothetical protein [Clostridia bacterium]
MSYDCWANVVSRHGFAADELVSTLQKMIRRGNAELAARIGYEMSVTSQALEDYMWVRLAVISVEDIGPAAPYLPALIAALDEQRKKLPYGTGDRMLFAVHAIRTLCRSEKTRSNDHLLNIMIREFNAGILPEIPDVAYDMHTRRGQAMGRDLMHFLNEASRVSPEWQGEEPDYKAQLLALIDKE